MFTVAWLIGLLSFLVALAVGRSDEKRRVHARTRNNGAFLLLMVVVAPLWNIILPVVLWQELSSKPSDSGERKLTLKEIEATVTQLEKDLRD